jgi:uncharacterized protein with PIN domain
VTDTGGRVADREHRLPYRMPAHTSQAWTCPECNASYWPPKEWEPILWRVVLEAARSMHAQRHAQERIDRAEGLI